MLSKFRRLNYKLTFIFAFSMIVFAISTLGYVEHSNFDRWVYHALRGSEQGLGYVNQRIPQSTDFQLISDSSLTIYGKDIENGLERFEPFVDKTTPGGVGWQTSVEGPVSFNGQDYYTITYKITRVVDRTPSEFDQNFELVSVMVPRSHFVLTIASLIDPSFGGDRVSDLYFLPVPRQEGLLFVVSMDRYSFPTGSSWEENLVIDVISSLPLLLIVSFGFGLVMSWMTVNPIRRITRATESLSRSDLSQRVEVKSKDEIGQLTQSFNIMADRLEEAFTQQKRFLSDAAHELRTPLASLKASVTKALTTERSNEEYRQLLSFILLRTDTLEELINDLLFLARADEGRLKIGEEIFDLSPVLLETADSFKYLFDERGISFSSSVEPGLWVKGDPKLYMRVISNLLDNASKYTPGGGSVILKAGYGDDRVEIIVEDDGIGMSEEHLAHAFDRFYNAPDKPTAEFSFGLGLSIAKSIVTAYNGEISVTSSLGKGSAFSVKFPEVAPKG